MPVGSLGSVDSTISKSATSHQMHANQWHEIIIQRHSRKTRRKAGLNLTTISTYSRYLGEAGGTRQEECMAASGVVWGVMGIL
mgnify:CR=1 FL=1